MNKVEMKLVAEKVSQLSTPTLDLVLGSIVESLKEHYPNMDSVKFVKLVRKLREDKEYDIYHSRR